MKTDKYTKRTFWIIIFTFFIGGMCSAQSVPIEELGISQKEYNDMQEHANEPVRHPSTRILTIGELFKPGTRVLDSNCIVKPWIIPMIPFEESIKELNPEFYNRHIKEKEASHENN